MPDLILHQFGRDRVEASDSKDFLSRFGKSSLPTGNPCIYKAFALQSLWCLRQDSNLHLFPNQILSLARLPIPPLRQGGVVKGHDSRRGAGCKRIHS